MNAARDAPDRPPRVDGGCPTQNLRPVDKSAATGRPPYITAGLLACPDSRSYQRADALTLISTPPPAPSLKGRGRRKHATSMAFSPPLEGGAGGGVRGTVSLSARWYQTPLPTGLLDCWCRFGDGVVADGAEGAYNS